MRARPHDREILRLAVPALGALAAEPLYVLVDTAIVGHLGTTQLASLAIAATVLSTAFTIFNFLTYGTTAQVARLHGAGAGGGGRARRRAGAVAGAADRRRAAGRARARSRGRSRSLMGAEGEVADGATTYLRIAALGAPAFMLASAGQGFLRGIGDLRTPLVILVVAHAVNVVLELLFVYGFGWGLAGSAWGTVIAQLGMGAAFLAVQLRAGWQRPVPARMRRLMRVGHGDRRAHDGAARLVPRRVRRARAVGPASLGAHQIAFQLFVFLALVLDALAIAAQVLVGRMLGRRRRRGRARGRRARMIALVGRARRACSASCCSRSATSCRGCSRATTRWSTRAHEIWWLFAALMPLNGAVFALDGILIGAGDTRFLMWGMLAAAAVYVPVALLALAQDWGIVGVWCGLAGADRRAAGDVRRCASSSSRWARVGYALP